MDTTQKTNEPDHVQASTSSPIILEYQRPAYEKLLTIANACFCIQRSTLPIRPRTNTLIIGPSGSGKTFLARAVAEHIGAPFLSVTVGEWILLGCTHRGAETTWPVIVQFFLKYRKNGGVVLFLDEIDKLCGHTSWETFLRTEIFKLLDLNIPEGLCDSDGNAINKDNVKEARDVLANRTFIIAGGAFQDIWETRSKTSIGFSSQSSPSQTVSLADLTGTIPSELGNRFRADIVTLPQLSRRDYRRMVEDTSAQVPVYLRETFLRLAHNRIESAMRCQQGCRFLEEVMLDTIIAERENIKNWKKPHDPPAQLGEPTQSTPDGPGC